MISYLVRLCAASTNFCSPSSFLGGGKGSGSEKKSKFDTIGDSDIILVTGVVSISIAICIAGRMTLFIITVHWDTENLGPWRSKIARSVITLPRCRIQPTPSELPNDALEHIPCAKPSKIGLHKTISFASSCESPS